MGNKRCKNLMEQLMIQPSGIGFVLRKSTICKTLPKQIV